MDLAGCLIPCSDCRKWMEVVSALYFLFGGTIAWVLGYVIGRAEGRNDSCSSRKNCKQ